MQARPGCRSVKSVRWAVEKVITQTEVTCDKKRIMMVISKSSFFFLGAKEENSERLL